MLFGLVEAKVEASVANLFGNASLIPTIAPVIPTAKAVKPKESLELDDIELDDIETILENMDNDEELDIVKSQKPSEKTEKTEQTRRQKKAEVIEKNQRTVFVGNLPIITQNKSQLNEFKALMKPFGKIESIRFRSIAFDAKTPRKVSFIQKNFHAKRDSCNAYVVYTEMESVAKAVAALNGTLFLEKHLRVDHVETSDAKKSQDPKRCAFVGNLSFDVSDESLFEVFGDCGDIENVRVVRDRKTNIGKGFAYVQFKDRASVGLALKLAGTKILKRPIRVTRCTPDSKTSKSIEKKIESSDKTEKKEENQVEMKRPLDKDPEVKSKTPKQIAGKLARTERRKAAVLEGTRAKPSDKPLLKPIKSKVSKKTKK